jgi:hypothetical protein
MPCSLIEVHEVVHAREEQPLSATQLPDERVIQGARIGFVSVDGLAARSTMR